MILRLMLFLALNFGGLYLGALLQSSGPSSEWYTNLNIAPWTPPGWVFGAAWTTIMICFSIYVSLVFEKAESNQFWIFFSVAWVLNVAWNPVFFRFHQMSFGLVILVALTALLVAMTWSFYSAAGKSSWLMAPYLIWMCIATSLNAYIVGNN